MERGINLNRVVSDSQDLYIFNSILSDVYSKNGYDFDVVQSWEKSSLYLILSSSRDPLEVVGTVEVKPYFPNISVIERSFPFSNNQILQGDGLNIAEIGRVTIIESHQSSGAFDNLLSTLAQHTQSYGIDFYVALMDRRLYRALLMSYGIPVTALGEKRFYKGHVVIPVLIDVRFAMSNSENYKWLKNKELPYL